ncbi:MAG: PEGA domain-containing protein [Lentisphaerae bacterium]|nr:PEGA domain-containing protein [Lentisphaerota bacterium]
MPEENAPPATGQLYVATDPSEASLFCNGVNQGLTPATITQLPGEYLITVKKAGFLEERRTVTFRANERQPIDIKMEPVTGLILIHSEPSGAEVILNDANKGKTPLFINDLLPGKYSMTVNLPNYLPKNIDLTVKDRTPVKINVEMAPDFADVKCESEPAGATLVVDGVKRGKTPMDVPKLSSGSHTIEFTLNGFAPVSRTIIVQASQPQTVSAKLSALPATFEISTEPAEARISVNEQSKGFSPVTVSVTPGTHVIKAELAGFGVVVSTNTIAGGQNSQVLLVLEKNSGTLLLTTEPAGVSVFIDGENRGSSRIGDSIQISEPFTVDLLSAGEHNLQLTKDGYHAIKKTVTIVPNQILPLHEKLKQIPIPFAPDVSVTIVTGSGSRHTYKGMLKERSNRNLILEIAPGVIREFQTSEIVNVELLYAEEKSEQDAKEAEEE